MNIITIPNKIGLLWFYLDKTTLALCYIFIILSTLLLGACIHDTAPISKIKTSNFVPGTLNEVVKVDQNGGFNFRVPIQIPPGIQGVQPKIALSYNSQQPNELLGKGWVLSGLPSITRVKRIRAIDQVNGTINYDGNDRFAYQGKRLIATSGSYGADNTLYRTEIESWQQFSSHGAAGTGPEYFIVNDKHGVAYEFGNTVDSRILAKGKTEVRTWKLNRITDLNGNSLSITYTGDPLNTGISDNRGYPLKISYTANGNYQSNRYVTFNYEARPDVVRKFIGGSEVTTSVRLKNIQTFVASNMVSDYRLTYDVSAATNHSRLISVARFPSNAADAVSLSPAVFSYSDGALKFSGKQNWLSDSFRKSQGWGGDNYPFTLADVNGDGFLDIVGFKNGVQVSLGSATAFSAKSQWIDNFSLSQGWNSSTRRLLADVSGDGLADIVGINLKGVEVALSNGTSFSTPLPIFKHFSSSQGWGRQIPVMIVDANGDHLNDIVGIKNGTAWVAIAQGDGTFATPTQWLSQFGLNGSNYQSADFNGDGNADLMLLNNQNTLKVALSTGSQFSTTTWGSQDYKQLCGSHLANSNTKLMMSDVNGDSHTDIIAFCTDAVYVTLSNGAGFQPSEQWNTQFAGPNWSAGNQRMMADVNGDGLGDLVGVTAQGVIASLSDGYQFNDNQWDNSSLPWGLNGSGSSTITTRLMGDANADGLMDMVGIGATDVYAGISSGSMSDLMVTATSSLGAEYTIDYSPLSDATVDTQQQSDGLAQYQNFPPLQSHPAYPVYRSAAHLGGHFHLVKMLTTQDKLTTDFTYQKQFAYTNGKLDLEGRGWLGFASKTSTDLSSGNIITRYYHQDFPLTSRLYSTYQQCTSGAGFDTQCTSTGTVLNTHNIQYNQTITVTGSVSPYPSVYATPKNTIRKDYFDYGTYQFSIGSTYQYDSWGNQTLGGYLGYVKQNGQDISSSDNVYTLQQFYPPAAGTWQLNYLQYKKISTENTPSTISQFNNEKDISLTQLMYSTDGKMNLKSKQQWDDTNNVYVTHNYQYDGFGNKTHITDPAGNTTTIAYESTYNTFKQSKTSPKNVNNISLTTQYNYDPRFGKLTATTGPNGNVHTLCYDTFGRLVKRQVPTPKSQTPITPSAQCVSSLATGNAPTASMVTTTKYQYTQTSSGFYCHVTQDLVNWNFTGTPTPAFSQGSQCIDALGRHRQNSHIGSGGTTVEVANYASQNLLISKTVPHFSSNHSPVSFTKQYDAYSRLIKATTPSGSDGSIVVSKTVSYSFNGDSLESTVTEASGSPSPYTKNIYHHIVNGKFKLHQIIVPDDNDASSTYVHDVLGRRKSMTDPIGVITSMSRDSLGRARSTSNPASGTVAFQYSPSGVLQTKTDNQGVTHYDFDNLGRMLGKTFFDNTQSNFSYDDPSASNGLGRLTGNSTEDSSGHVISSKTFGYDSSGKISSQNMSVFNQQFSSTYVNFPDGSPWKTTYPDSSVQTRTRNNFGELTSISIAETNYVTFSNYDMSARAKTVTYANGLVENRSYWPIGMQGSYSIADSQSNSLYDETYSWNQLGLLGTTTDNLSYNGVNLSQTFGYTAMRLTSANAPGSYGNKSYAYNNGGNLISLNSAQPSDTIVYTYETAPSQQIKNGVNAKGATVFDATYDSVGNTQTLLDDSTTWTFGYDPQNRMTSASNGTDSTSYGYDANAKPLWKINPQGRTIIYVNKDYTANQLAGVSKQTIKYIRDAHKPIASITNTTDLTAQTVAVAPTISTIFFHRNYYGSTIASSVNTPAVTELSSRVVYEPLGKIYSLTGSGNYHRKYAGLELDNSTKLYNHSTRFLNAGLGRFMSADTGLAADWARQDAHNRYAYGLNAASTFADVSGLLGCRATGSIAGGVIGVAGGTVGGVAAGYGVKSSMSTGGAAAIGTLTAITSGTGEALGVGGGIYLVCESFKKAARRAQTVPEAQRPLINTPEAAAAEGDEEMAAAPSTVLNTNQTVATTEAETQTIAQSSEEELAEIDRRIAANRAARLAEYTNRTPRATRPPIDTSCLCFTGNTLVATAKGKVNIASIDKGDAVWSYNFEEAQASIQPVVEQNVTAKPVKKLVRISVNGNVIDSTVEHPFWVVDKEQWVPAEELVVGDQLLSRNNQQLSIDAIELLNGDFKVYNFEVEKNHNYYVSESEVLVHNLSCQGERTGLGENTEVGSQNTALSSESAAGVEESATTSAAETTEAAIGEAAADIAEGAAAVEGAEAAETLIEILPVLLL